MCIHHELAGEEWNELRVKWYKGEGDRVRERVEETWSKLEGWFVVRFPNSAGFKTVYNDEKGGSNVINIYI